MALDILIAWSGLGGPPVGCLVTRRTEVPEHRQVVRSAHVLDRLHRQGRTTAARTQSQQGIRTAHPTQVLHLCASEYVCDHKDRTSFSKIDLQKEEHRSNSILRMRCAFLNPAVRNFITPSFFTPNFISSLHRQASALSHASCHGHGRLRILVNARPLQSAKCDRHLVEVGTTALVRRWGVLRTNP